MESHDIAALAELYSDISVMTHARMPGGYEIKERCDIRAMQYIELIPSNQF
jgi:hypothetical protein